MDKNRGAEGSGSNQHEVRLHDATAPTYAELGIEKTAVHRWNVEASLPEEQFEAYIAEVQEPAKVDARAMYMIMCNE